MFDIGFSEVLLIFVLALVVLGPEKLPKVAAQVGRWIGRARGMARQFREQLEEEVNLEEARKSQAARTPSPPPAPETPIHPAASQVPSPAAPAAEPEPPPYRDGYSHVHDTDELGRPVPEPLPPDAESGQQDWVGGVTGTEKPAQTATPAAYAPSHERGT